MFISHCFFVSNCVGLRNHKFFYLFLLYGTIGAFYIAILNIIHLFYVFFLYEIKIFPLVFHENKILFFVCIGLILISIIYLSCGTQDFALLLGPFSVGYGIFIYLFYKSIPNGVVYPSYFNPYSMIALIGSFSLGCFVGANLGIQTNQIMAGYTTKQIASIRNEVYKRKKNSEEQIDDKFLQDNSKNEKIYNLINFVCQKQEPSLIIPERDL